MSERITARIKEFRLNTSSPPPAENVKPEVTFDADKEEAEVSTPKVDKGKQRATDSDSGTVIGSPPPLSPPLPPARIDTLDTKPPTQPIPIGDLLLTPQELSALLTRAKSEMNLRPVKFPLLGEYQDSFTGEEFASWLKENVKAFEGSLDRAEDAAKDLTEKHNLLRRLGELGNAFENDDDAHYQFRPKVSIPFVCLFVCFNYIYDACRPSTWMLQKLARNSLPLPSVALSL